MALHRLRGMIDAKRTQSDPDSILIVNCAMAASREVQSILFVVDGSYPSMGGAEMQARLLSRSFLAMGKRISIVAPDLLRPRPRHEVIDGVPVERITYPRIRLFGAAILYIRFAALLVARRRRYHAIHVHMAKNLAAIAGLLGPLLGITVTTKISGAWEFQGGILDPVLRRRPWNRFLNFCIKRADYIQCVSAFTRQMLVEAGYPNERLALIPNAVDVSRFRVTDRDDVAAQVVFVGRHVAVKGLDVLLRAWRDVAVGTEARLVLVGDGPERSKLEALARELVISSSVSFVGAVSDVPFVLAQSTIYVQPSYQEGLSNAILEAMASGLPVVATRISGSEDLISDGDNGFLVPPGDSTALAHALRRLMESPDLARRMGQRGRDIVASRYSVNVVLNQLLSAYETPAAH